VSFADLFFLKAEDVTTVIIVINTSMFAADAKKKVLNAVFVEYPQKNGENL